MRLPIAFLFLLSLFIFSTEAQNISVKKESDKDINELVGPVHQVRIQRELVYSTEGRDFDGGWIPSLTIYNPNGFVWEFTAYDDEGNLDYKSVSEFDSSGNKIHEATYDVNGKLSRKAIMAYDSRGNMIESKAFGNEDLSLMSWVRFAYNRKGDVISHSYFNKQGQALSVTRNLYYRNGKKKAEIAYDAQGNLLHRNAYYYNKKNVEIVVFDKPNIVTRRYVSLEDEAGERTELGYDEDRKLMFKENFTYERDGRGNWIKEVCSEWEVKDETPILKRIKITTRTITYY